ncbi:hypothetical protein D3C73_1196910 [compost metagenome]
MPARRGVGQAVEQPLLLLCANNASFGKFHLPALRDVHLLAAVLAGIEQVQVQQRAVTRATEHLHMTLARERRSAQRHVLVIRLERLCAAQQEQLAGRTVLVFGTRPVVVHFMVVERHEPR